MRAQFLTSPKNGKTVTKLPQLRTRANVTTSLASSTSRWRSTRRRRLSPIEQLEARCCLAAVAFADHEISTGDSRGLVFFLG